MAKPSRELQFSTHQLIGVFLGILALGIFVFLLGVSIGKKQALLAAAGGAVPGPKIETAAPKTPLTGESAPSDIQKEIYIQMERNENRKSDHLGQVIAGAMVSDGRRAARAQPSSQPFTRAIL